MNRTAFFAIAGAMSCLLAACTDDAARPSTAKAATTGGWTLRPGGDLNAFFDCLDARERTLVSAHRGGPAPGYPENAIETLKATLAATPAIMEVDVAASVDGVLFLLHDDTLDRTTTGEGVAEEMSWSELSGLRLVDNEGARTPFSLPRFSDVLAWAKDRTVLQIDFKRSARYEDVINEIYRQNAEHSVILIAYSMASARKLHELAPDMMISLSIETIADLNRAVAAGVPANRLVGFTGIEAVRPRLLLQLDERDVEGIFGTLGGADSIDRQIVASGDEKRYAEIAAAGADIIATDRPHAAFVALAEAGRAPESGACGISAEPRP